MRYGFVIPGGTAREKLDMAVEAEAAGWDGVFVWEAHYGVEAWSLLAAMATRTERIYLGTMLTPLPWRRPWQVASQAITLHDLSGGRAILAVGTGAIDQALGTVHEEEDVRVRAARLDEGIDVMRALWTGERVHKGEHYDVDLRARDVAVSRASVPVWCVGAWPRPRSMQRVLKCDGLLPQVMTEPGEEGFAFDSRFRSPRPDDVAAMIAWLGERGGAREGFDVINEGETPADDPAQAAEIAQPWAEIGCTWWLESRWSASDLDVSRQRITAGPPRL